MRPCVASNAGTLCFQGIARGTLSLEQANWHMLVQHQLRTNYCLLGTKFEQFAAAAGKVLIIAVPFRRP